MKRLLLTLLLIPFTLSASEIFLLPDHTTDALHTIDTLIRNTQNDLLIITPVLKSKKIQTRIEKLISSGIKTTLITSSEHAFEISALLQYRHIDLLTLDGLQGDHLSGKTATTLILIDQKEVCLSTTTLDEQAMRQDIGFLECNREPQRVKIYLRHAETLKARSKRYLK